MRSRIILLILTTLFGLSESMAQNVSINLTGDAADTSAMLDISSTTKGLLIPRMTQAQRNAIFSPADGLLVYQTDTLKGVYYYHTGIGWSMITTAANTWQVGGNSGTNSATNFLGTIDQKSLRFRTNNMQGLLLDSAGNVAIGNAPMQTIGNMDKLLIDAGSTMTNPTTSYNLITGKGFINSYLQLNTQNKSNGANASSDVVATADNGDENNNYVNVGINSSGNTSNYYGGANDAYLYNLGQNLLIGTGTAGKVLAFLTGGGTQSSNERMRIDGNGNVGIGTNSPTALLDVNGTTRIRSLASGATTDSIVTADANGVLKRRTVSSVLGGSSVTTNTLTSTGNTLTNTTNGVAASANIINTVSNTSSGNNLTTTINGVAGSAVPMVNSNVLSLTGTNLTSTVNGIASSALDLSAAITGNTWSKVGNSGTNATTNFIGTTDAADLVTRTNNAERMRVTSSGNVGINNNTPGSALDIKGTLRLSGTSSGYVGFSPASAAGSTTYTLPSADGTSGQVLGTNGSGVLSWVNPNGLTRSFSALITAGNIQPLTRYFNSEGTIALMVQLQSPNSGNSGTRTYLFQGGFNGLATANDWYRLLPVFNGRGHGEFPNGFDLYVRRTDGYTYDFGVGVNTSNKTIRTTFNDMTNGGMTITDISSTAAAAIVTAGDVYSVRDMFVQNNIGINTATPGSALDVKGTMRLSGATSGFVGFSPAANAGSTTYTLPAADGTIGQQLTTNGSGTLAWANAGGTSTNTLSSSANVLTSTVNGIAATANVVNSIINTSSVNNLTTTVNGVAATAVPMINSNTLSLTGNNITSTVNGIATAPIDLSGVAWSRTGNSGTNANSHFIGTTDGIDFVTRTNNTERLRVTSGGNVGINNNAPGSALDVKGTLRLSGTSSGYVGFAPASAAGSTTYTLPSADGTSGQVLGTNGTGVLSWINPNGLTRSFSAAITAGNIQPLTRYSNTEGTISLLVQLQSPTAGNSGTRTYLFQGGYNSLATFNDWYKMQPMFNGRGHGEFPNGFDLYVRMTSGTTYEFAVGVNTSNKTIRTTFNDLTNGGVSFSDISATAATTILSVGDVYSVRDMIVQNNIGINTTTPGSALDVKGTMRLSGATSGYVGFAPATNAGSTTYTFPSADGTIGQQLTTNGSGVLAWANAVGTTTNTISSSANVITSTVNGIAATANVVNSISNTSSVNNLTTTVNGVAATAVPMINSNTLSLTGNNITSTVNGIATAAIDLSGVAWSRTGNSGTNASSHFIGTTDGIDFVTRTNNTERLRVTSGGNVGINNNAPGSALDVKGTLRLSGTSSGYVGFAPASAAGSTIYTLPSADGTSGQVLGTNGSGVLSWINPNGLTRSFSALITAGNIQPLTRYSNTEGTISLLVQLQSPTAGNSGTRTYLFQGGYNSLATFNDWYKMQPMFNGRGHGEFPNGFDLYVRMTSGTTYEFAVGVNTSNKTIRTTFNDLTNGGVSFSDISATAATTILSVGDVYSVRDMIVQNNIGINTTTPGSALDVKGTMRLSGATSGYVGFAPATNAGSTTYTLPSADGTTGQVLSTNGSGVLNWSNANGLYRSYSMAVTAGNLQPLTRYTNTEGTVSVFIQLQSPNAGNSGTRTYLFQGGYNCLATTNDWYKMQPLFNGRGHGEFPNGFDLYVRMATSTTYEFAVGVNTSNKTIRSTFNDLTNGGLTFTDISSTASTAIVSVGDAYSVRDMIVQNNIGINTTTPGSALDVKGTMRLSGLTSGYVGFAPATNAGSTTYTLPAADGTTGQQLTTNGSGTLTWANSAGITTVSNTSSGNNLTTTVNGAAATAVPMINTNALSLSGTTLTSTVNGVASNALTLPVISSLNTLTSSTQTFATGTSGSDFNILSAGSTHTFNLPDAGQFARGLVTTGAQTYAGNKTFNGNIIVDGGASNDGTFGAGAGIRFGWAGSGEGIVSKRTAGGNANGIDLLTASTSRLSISNAGNVGINNTAPGSALDVKGALRLSGSTSGYVGFSPAANAGSTTYTLPSADGTSGQVLGTNGTGLLSWVNANGLTRSFSAAITAGNLQPLTRYFNTEGTVALMIQLQSLTASNSGTRTYLFQGGYNVLATTNDWYKMQPLFNGRGHGEFPNGFDLYVRMSNSYTYDFAVGVNNSNKTIRSTFNDITNGGMTFTDMSATATAAITSAGDVYSLRDMIVQNNVGIGTTAPGSALDVKGILRLSGSTSGFVGFAPAAAAGSTTYTLPSADGINGQVLSTNGSGTLSWTTASAAASSDWSLGGNAGTSPSTQFIGTTDAQNLVFRRNNVVSGTLASTATSFGVSSSANATNGTAYGVSATAGANAVAIGNGALANFANSVAIGSGSQVQPAAGSTDNIAIGTSANVSGGSAFSFSTAIGSSAQVQASNALGIGANTSVSSQYALAMGDGAAAQAVSAIVIGQNAYANGINSIAIGSGLLANKTQAQGSYSISLGYNAYSNSLDAIAIGDKAQAQGINALAIGSNLYNGTANTVAIGNSSVISAQLNGAGYSAGKAMVVGTASTNGNGAYLTTGGTWTNASDRNLKDQITPVNGEQILNQLRTLDITKWRYKGTREYHVGPMAQDFYKIFKLGTDDKHISTIDPAGISLVAVKALNEKVEQQQTMIEQLQQALKAMEAKMNELIKTTTK